MPQIYQKVLWEYRVALVKKTYRIFFRIEEENTRCPLRVKNGLL
jgi:hypothetical protein